MPRMKDDRRIESRSVESLQPYPLQGEMFGDVSQAELEDLAADIAKNGLLQPIEVLPCGTIIAGHQRLRAVKLLGWKHVPCWIRDDLVEQGEAAIEARFVEDNLHRRHLTKLSIARAYRHLKELQREAETGEVEGVAGDLRDHLGKRFRMSGRSLDRLEKMLDAPLAVQQSFERDELTQDAVLAVVRLSPEDQEAIAERLQNGEKPADVVADVLQRPAATPKAAQRAFRKFMSDLNAARNKLQDSVSEIGSSSAERDLRVLREYRDILIPRLIQRIEEDEAIANDWSDCVEFLPEVAGQSDRPDVHDESD